MEPFINNKTTGYNEEWFYDNRIVAYTLEYATVATLENWTMKAFDEIRNWPKNQPYLALHDLSQPGVGLLYMTATKYDIYNIAITPGGKQRVEEIVEHYPEWRLALAVVVSTSLSGQLAKLNMTFKQDVLGQRTKAKAFFGRESALTWLQQQTV